MESVAKDEGFVAEEQFTSISAPAPFEMEIEEIPFGGPASWGPAGKVAARLFEDVSMRNVQGGVAYANNGKRNRIKNDLMV